MGVGAAVSNAEQARVAARRGLRVMARIRENGFMVLFLGPVQFNGLELSREHETTSKKTLRES
jgi:hypothetical protein